MLMGPTFRTASSSLISASASPFSASRNHPVTLAALGAIRVLLHSGIGPPPFFIVYGYVAAETTPPCSTIHSRYRYRSPPSHGSGWSSPGGAQLNSSCWLSDGSSCPAMNHELATSATAVNIPQSPHSPRLITGVTAPFVVQSRSGDE